MSWAGEFLLETNMCSVLCRYGSADVALDGILPGARETWETPYGTSKFWTPHGTKFDMIAPFSHIYPIIIIILSGKPKVSFWLHAWHPLPALLALWTHVGGVLNKLVHPGQHQSKTVPPSRRSKIAKCPLAAVFCPDWFCCGVVP